MNSYSFCDNIEYKEIESWEGMVADWVRALKACLPKNVNEMLNMVIFTHSTLSEICNGTTWDGSRNDIDTQLCVQIWDQKDFKGCLSERMENSFFLSNSEFKNQGIIQFLKYQCGK